MFENRSDALASRWVFLRRVLLSASLALAVTAFSLLVGAIGYHYFGELDWVDALLNAAIILTGMGPVDPLSTVSGKLFATGYCLFSGIIFLTLLAILLTPIYHRFLHSFHLAEDNDDGEPE
ncbi:hypothetical protein [Schlesneria sp.]|uniref:hypothetical protein n=1 Tax=Schlesneria sp. TaxID=2762018 RepID=UPI002F1FFF91